MKVHIWLLLVVGSFVTWTSSLYGQNEISPESVLYELGIPPVSQTEAEEAGSKAAWNNMFAELNRVEQKRDHAVDPGQRRSNYQDYCQTQKDAKELYDEVLTDEQAAKIKEIYYPDLS